ncbi:MAG: septum formation protein Maf [Firmicutes bacterium]|nr:septum formation protein Maf [Bacillota bacterium]
MKNIVLASGSPRRRELLKRYNIGMKVKKSNIQELVFEDEKPHHVAMALAFEKAYDVSLNVESKEIVLAADTIVYSDKILGKPKDKKEAFEMLLSLSGKKHSVITGISIIKAGTNIKIIDYEETIVKFRKLSSKTINSYIETGEYEDKAGGYGIQGIGAILVDHIYGSYSNVVGLPISKLDYLLTKHFSINLL